MRCNMLRVRSAQDAGNTARRWAEVGGTHVAISTMGMGHATVEQHIDYAAKALDAINIS